ncbi:MAG: zinc-dependent alcohol dehydrogenase, partial [Candidatus Binatia bacterium]
MRAAFCPAAGTIALREVAAPEPGPGEVVVRVRACGICGSDLHWFLGSLRPPHVCPGHEIAGEIAALGAGVAGWHAGDRVAVEPLVACGICRYCRAGQPQLCRTMQIIGQQQPGGLAELVAVPAGALFAVPAGLSWPIAALAEPTAVCVHAYRLAALPAGARVLILGAGSVGLLS